MLSSVSQCHSNEIECRTHTSETISIQSQQSPIKSIDHNSTPKSNHHTLFPISKTEYPLSSTALQRARKPGAEPPYRVIDRDCLCAGFLFAPGIRESFSSIGKPLPQTNTCYVHTSIPSSVTLMYAMSESQAYQSLNPDPIHGNRWRPLLSSPK